jgi:uncharacterized protein YjbJ (UPF0337 family)
MTMPWGEVEWNNYGDSESSPLSLNAIGRSRIGLHSGALKLKQNRTAIDPCLRQSPEPIADVGLRNAWLVVRFGLGMPAWRKEMKPSTKDQIKGTLHEMKGKFKEKAGQVTDNPKLTAEGQAEKLAGKIQKKIGQIQKVFEK